MRRTHPITFHLVGLTLLTTVGCANDDAVGGSNPGVEVGPDAASDASLSDIRPGLDTESDSIAIDATTSDSDVAPDDAEPDAVDDSGCDDCDDADDAADGCDGQEEVCLICQCQCPDVGPISLPGPCAGACDEPPDASEVCPAVCATGCPDADCANAEFTPFAKLAPNLESVNGSEVWVEGVLARGFPACTERACPVEDPCCNGCSTRLGFAADTVFYPLDTVGDRFVGCTGDECDPFAECDPNGPGETLRGRFLVDTSGPGDGATLYLMKQCPTNVPPRRANARLVWQAPGGVVGWGPAVIIDGKGAVRVWQQVFGFDPASEPSEEPDISFEVSTAAADNLFDRWATADTARLPHDGGGAECSPSVTVRLCEDCDGSTILYNVASQLEPEMEPVWAWFDAVLVDLEALLSPRNYCRF